MLVNGMPLQRVGLVPMTLLDVKAQPLSPAEFVFDDLWSGRYPVCEWSSACHEAPLFYRLLLNSSAGQRVIDFPDQASAESAGRLIRAVDGFERDVDGTVALALLAPTRDDALAMLNRHTTPLSLYPMRGPIPIASESESGGAGRMKVHAGKNACVEPRETADASTLFWTVYRREFDGRYMAHIDVLDLDDARLMEQVACRAAGAGTVTQDLYSQRRMREPGSYAQLDVAAAPCPRLRPNATAQDVEAWLDALQSHGVQLCESVEVPEYGSVLDLRGEPIVGRRALLDLADDLVAALGCVPDLAQRVASRWPTPARDVEDDVAALAP